MGIELLPLPDKFKAFASQICSIRPEDHSVSYTRRAWDKQFSGDPEYSAVVTAHSGRLRRGDVFELARASALKSPASIKRFFIGTMIWGFGDDNRGPARTRRFIDFPGLAHTLEITMDHLARRDYRMAYDCNDIPECGPAFFSKFLYFAGQGLPISPKPLIQDSRVATSLDHVLGSACRKQLVKGNTDKNGRVWVEHGPEEYVNFVHSLDSWATALTCTSDCIELFLFNPPPGF